MQTGRIRPTSFDIQLAKNFWAASGRTDNLLGFDLLKFFNDFGCSMSAAGQVQELHEGRMLELGNFNLEVLHTPGHSPGHISLNSSIEVNPVLL